MSFVFSSVFSTTTPVVLPLPPQQAGPLPVRPADPGGERRAQLLHPHHHLQPPGCAIQPRPMAVAGGGGTVCHNPRSRMPIVVCPLCTAPCHALAVHWFHATRSPPSHPSRSGGCGQAVWRALPPPAHHILPQHLSVHSLKSLLPSPSPSTQTWRSLPSGSACPTATCPSRRATRPARRRRRPRSSSCCRWVHCLSQCIALCLQQLGRN